MKSKGAVIILVIGILCLSLAAWWYFSGTSLDNLFLKDTEYRTLLPSMHARAVIPTHTANNTHVSLPTPTATPTIEVTATPWKEPPSVDDINRDMKSFMFVVNMFIDTRKNEKFDEPFKNTSGGYTYLHPSGSAIVFKVNENNQYMNIMYWSKINKEDWPDDDLTIQEADTMANILICSLGSNCFDAPEVYDFLDEIIESDPKTLLFETEVNYNSHHIVYQSSPAWGQTLEIEYIE